MDEREVIYLENSEQVIGYRVKIMRKPSFTPTGICAISGPVWLTPARCG